MDIIKELFKDVDGIPEQDPEPEAAHPRHVSIAMTAHDLKVLRHFYFKLNGRQTYIDGAGQSRIVTDWNHVYRAILQQLYVLDMNTPKSEKRTNKQTTSR